MKKLYVNKHAITKIQTILIITVIVIAAIAGGLIYYFMTQPTQQVAQKTSIKIGFSISLSGVGAAAGTEQYRAYEIWRKWINEQGGIYVEEYKRKLSVEFIYYDDASEPARAASLYEKLIVEDKVDLLLTPWGTFIHLAIVPVIEKYKIPVVGNTAGVDIEKINELNTKYMFFTWPEPKTSAFSLTLFLEELNVKSVAILYAQTDFTVLNAKWNKQYIEEKGFADVVIYEGYPLEVTDVSGILLKVKDKNPEAVVVHSYPADAILVTSQMKELKINPKVFILGVGGQLLAYKQRFDDQTKEGVIAINNWHPDFYPESKELYNKYILEYGYNPPSHTLGLGWLSCLVLQQAIEKAGTLNPEKIREKLATETFNTPFGEVKFENQVNIKSLVVFDQWQEGDLKPVFVTKGSYPNVEKATEYKLAQLIFPKPEW